MQTVIVQVNNRYKYTRELNDDVGCVELGRWEEILTPGWYKGTPDSLGYRNLWKKRKLPSWIEKL